MEKPVFTNWDMICNQSGNVCIHQIREVKMLYPSTTFSICWIDGLIIIVI